MDLLNLRKDLELFRSELEKIVAQGGNSIFSTLSEPNPRFPKGTCQIVSNLTYFFIVGIYNELAVNDFRLGFGNADNEKRQLGGYDHYWLEFKNIWYIDITADQFTNNFNDRVIVENKETNKFYQRFKYKRSNSKIDFYHHELNPIISELVQNMRTY